MMATAAPTDPHAQAMRSRHMRALVWEGSAKVRVETVDKPDLIKENDAIVRVTAATICGSDLHLYHKSIPGMERGDIVGHECIGFVEHVGGEVETIEPGDLVVVSAVISCGQCDFCRAEQYSLCDKTNPSIAMRKLYGGDATAGLFGYSHITGAYQGSQAQYVRVPFADVNTLKVPHNVPDERLLLLSDVLPTSWHGNELIHVGTGDHVAIWGCGPIGLCAAMWARHRGAAQVVSIDAVPERLELASKMGATDVINYKEEPDVVAKLKELCKGGGPNKCIDCVGFRYAKTWSHGVLKAMGLETDACDVATECILACRKGGSVALIGDYVGYTNAFPIGAMMEKSLTVTGGQLFAQKYWKKLLAKITTPGTLHVDPSLIFTHRMPLELAPKAYSLFDNKEAIKILLRPWGTEEDIGEGAGHRIVREE